MKQLLLTMSSFFICLSFYLNAQNTPYSRDSEPSPEDLEWELMDPTETDAEKMDIDIEMTRMDEAASRRRQKEAEKRLWEQQQQKQE